MKRFIAAGAALAAAGAVAGAVAACGATASSSPSAAASAGSAVAASMATSLATPEESWAIVPMAADPAFWQVFARAANSPDWKLVTPPGVAINGGLIASADGADSLSVAVRPSQDLTFTPLAATTDGGSSWSAGGPLDAGVAPSPDAYAADGNNAVALLTNGTIETSSDAGESWSALAKPGAIAASPAAKGCGPVKVTSVSFGISAADVLAGGTCGTSGTTAVFSYTPAGGWQRLRLPVAGQFVRFTGGMALVRGKSGLSALWNGLGWYAYSPPAQPSSWTKSVPLPAAGPVTASGTLAGGAWALLPGGRAVTISSSAAAAGATPQWVMLPSVPAHTSVLASGPAGATDALAVSGSALTVWRLASGQTAWSKVQTISVPIQVGSSG
jgi:hypothetical protein